MKEDIEIFAILKSLRDQIQISNTMFEKIISQNNDNYKRIENKVDDIEKKVDTMQIENRDMVNGIATLAIEINNSKDKQNDKIQNIEMSFGHLAGEACPNDVKKFCEEMNKNEDKIKKILKKQIEKEENIKLIKNESIKKITVGVICAVSIILYTVFIKWNDVVKLFKP